MKRLALISLLALCSLTVLCQSKPKQKDAVPTQKEINDMMKEMQQEMQGMSAEDKKAMDSMGIKMPDMKQMQKNMAGVTDAQLKKGFEDDKRIVPQKNTAKIQAALSRSLQNNEIAVYITSTHQKVATLLPATDRSVALQFLQQTNTNASPIGNTAVGLWIDGKPAIALYLMGEACKKDPGNAVNINNYASFLTMCGAQHIALPLLMNLNKQFPANSTILNNIAQAWLGLGDITRAGLYADSAIRIVAHHPQANMAKCIIEESKGNIPAAIAAARAAISKSYSVAKDNKLKKLGYELKPDDLDWDRPMPQDPLGLDHVGWPAYPMHVDENKIQEQAWKDFRIACQEKIDVLKSKQRTLEAEVTAANGNRTNAVIAQMQNGNMVQLMPGYAAKAIRKLGPSVNDIDGNSSFVFVKAAEPVAQAYLTVAGFKDQLDAQQKQLDIKYEDEVGEGRRNPLAEICEEENKIRSAFLKSANGLIDEKMQQYLTYAKRRTSDLLYYCQYTMWPEQFELAKVTAQIAWLMQIKDQNVQFKAKSNWCVPIKVKFDSAKLQAFDDVACQYVSTMKLGVYKITSSCSNLTGEFDFGGVKIDVHDNVETGKFSGSAIVGVSKGFDGPMGLEAEATLAGLVEFDNTGITDVGAIANVEGGAGGMTVGGAEARATMNTGVSITGSSFLDGLK